MTPAYPVWSIRPNWREGVLERLEWLTDVLTSSTGVEQRRALRLSPRRYIEITVNPTNNERSFLDLVLHRLGSDEWLCPLWFDQAKLTADAALGASRVDFDNTYREFLTGGFALLYQDTFTWEVISIGGQDDDGLDLDVVLDGNWSAGAKVYPLRLARLSTETSLDALTTTVGESVLLFQVIEANDYTATTPADLTFEGMPVLVTPPNRSQIITTDHMRLASEQDNRTGIPYRTDPAERAFQIQGHSWIKQGRQEQSEFREFLYWLRGRQRALWLPSFNQDFVVSRNSALASTNLDIQKIGYTYAGSGEIVPGRDAVLINGVTPARITNIGVPQSAAEERLRVGAGLAAAVVSGVPGSFLSTVRLNQDTVEIMHHADSDGAMECSLTFQSFKNSRTTAGAIYFPIPPAEMDDLPCGLELVTLINVDADVHGGSTATSMLANGITVSGFSPSDVLYLTQPPGQTYAGWSPWGNPGPPVTPGSRGAANQFWVVPDGNPALVMQIGDPSASFAGYEAARQAFGFETITGYSSYTFGIIDSPLGDNSGGVSIRIDK